MKMDYLNMKAITRISKENAQQVNAEKVTQAHSNSQYVESLLKVMDKE